MSLRHLTREAARLLRCERASVWLVGSDGSGPLRLAAYLRARDRHQEVHAFPDELGRHTAGLLESLSVLVMEDVENGVPAARPLRTYLQDEGVRALLAVPLRRGGAVRGFLVFEELSAPRAWSGEDREHAQLLTGQAEELLEPLLGTAQEELRASSPEFQRTLYAGGGQPAPDPRSYHAGGERELRARLARLRAMEGSGILAADLAHELLHLLEIQDGYLALLGPALQDRPADQELLAEAREAGSEARRRTLGFLRWARDATAALQPLELNAFLGRLGTRLGKVTGEEVGLLLVPSFEKVPVRSDPDLLERAVAELVRNARRASPEGGRVRVQVQRGRGPAEREVARLVVEDEGEGISPRDLPWIFEPFYAPDGRGRDSGAGLGLALVQAVVEGHGGWVDLTSVQGKGTKVTLTFPLLVEPTQARPERAAAPHEDEAVADRPRILLLEDDPFLARLVRRALDRSGHEVLAAASVAEAERILTREGGRISLLAVERALEGGGRGVTLLKAAWRSRPGLAAVVLDRRGRDRSESGLRALRKEEGIPPEVPILVPPFDPAGVVASVQGLLESAGDAAPASQPASPGADAKGDGEPPVH